MIQKNEANLPDAKQAQSQYYQGLMDILAEMGRGKTKPNKPNLRQLKSPDLAGPAAGQTD